MEWIGNELDVVTPSVGWR